MILHFCFTLANTHLYERDASNNLSSGKLLDFINKSHPRKRIKGKANDGVRYEKLPIWGTKTGFHSFKQEGRHSDLQVYGTGIVVYF